MVVPPFLALDPAARLENLFRPPGSLWSCSARAQFEGITHGGAEVW